MIKVTRKKDAFRRNGDLTDLLGQIEEKREMRVEKEEEKGKP